MKKLILIDSNALVHRAFHALPPTLTSPKGVLTNAVYGFTSVLLKMFRDLKPDYIAATYDLAGPTFRHKEFKEYKAQRVKAPDELYAQIPLTKEVLKSFGIPIYEKQGFEADDLIGALAEKAKKNKDIQTVIVTGDLDTLQLVDGQKVVVFTLRKGLTDTVTYNEEGVNQRYGFGPGQITDFKGLKGDPSDNIPGVPGIGEKTASTLIQEYGNIEKMYERFEKNKKDKTISDKLKEKLISNKEQAFFSKKLATIIRDVDVDFEVNKADWRKNMDLGKVENIFKEFGFYSLVKRLAEFDFTGTVSTPADTLKQTLNLEPKNSIQELRGNDLVRNLDKISGTGELIVYTDGDIFAWSENGEKCFSTKLNNKVWKALIPIFQNEKIGKIGHDLKPLVKKFLEAGTHTQGLSFDTKIAAYLIKADRKDYDLPTMYLNEFGEDLTEGAESKIAAIKKLKEHFEAKLKSDGLLKIFEEIELPLIPVLAEVELNGIKIDTNSLKKLSQSVNSELLKLEKEIYRQAGTQFNINSPKQLKEILFERLQIKGKVRKTAKGALSTAAGELDKLSGEHPIIDMILKNRELQKLKTTYIDPFPHLVNPKTSRLHTTFNQTGTVTGRVSSQDPNLQNIPIRTELGQEFRKAFVSSPGYKLISFDYSQLELRIAAHVSGDTKMINAFKRGEDIHTRTAAEIFGVSPEQVTANMRRDAKAMNFGLLYGMGVVGFQRASGVSREQAREFIDRYMAEFSGIAKFMENMKIKARQDGYVSTIFGRRRYLPEINSGIPQLIAQAERMAINHPIQGTEGDFLRIAMSRISDLIHGEYNDQDVRMLLQVHDELLFEVKNNLVESITPKIKNIMASVYQLSAPLVVDAKYGDNWRDLENI